MSPERPEANAVTQAAWVNGTFRGRCLLGCLLRQVRLLVQDEEGGDAQLPLPQQLHAALRRRRVIHHDVVQRAGRCGDGNVKLGVYGAQISCTHMPQNLSASNSTLHGIPGSPKLCWAS